MMIKKTLRILPLAIISTLFLSACAETELVTHIAKQLPRSASQGTFKVGNPYKVMGKRYVPQETYNFTETGIASWYGSQFHGKPTANGEIYDMYELTAAHKTLQIPSLVRVTNLENGRSLVVRVNDRGPFHRGRVIDLSKRAAELLDFQHKGTAKVKLQVLGEESRAIAMAAKRGEDTSGIEIAMNERGAQPKQQTNPPVHEKEEDSKTAPMQLAQNDKIEPAAGSPVSVQPVEAQSLSPAQLSPRISGNNLIRQTPVTPTQIYVQAGAFSEQANAASYARSLRQYGQAKIFPTEVNGQQFFRVRFGPLRDVAQADSVLTRLASAGKGEAMIIVD